MVIDELSDPANGCRGSDESEAIWPNKPAVNEAISAKAQPSLLGSRMLPGLKNAIDSQNGSPMLPRKKCTRDRYRTNSLNDSTQDDQNIRNTSWRNASIAAARCRFRNGSVIMLL
jgi:hypothetical protein